MFIQSLRIENFQSHKDTTLQLHPQFNALIGTGNSGKTAIVRALSFVLFGQWSPSWVRHGAKFCRITLVTSTGVEVVREKGEKVNRYVVTQNGTPQVYENFGTKVPAEIEKVLNISSAKVGEKEELNLNLSSQLDPLFLLSSPGSFKAKVLGKLSKAHYLDHALREINKDKKRLSSEKALAEKEIEILQIDLKKYDDVDAEKARLEQLGKRLEAVSGLDSRLEKLRTLQRRMTMWKEAYLTTTAALQAIPNVEPNILDTLSSKIIQLNKVKELRNKIIQFKSTYQAAQTLTTEIQTTRTLLTEKYMEVLKQNKACPTCFNTIDDVCINHIKESL
jgi:exonuclease SbcC